MRNRSTATKKVKESNLAELIERLKQRQRGEFDYSDERDNWCEGDTNPIFEEFLVEVRTGLRAARKYYSSCLSERSTAALDALIECINIKNSAERKKRSAAIGTSYSGAPVEEGNEYEAYASKLIAYALVVMNDIPRLELLDKSSEGYLASLISGLQRIFAVYEKVNVAPPIPQVAPPIPEEAQLDKAVVHSPTPSIARAVSRPKKSSSGSPLGLILNLAAVIFVATLAIVLTHGVAAGALLAAVGTSLGVSGTAGTVVGGGVLSLVFAACVGGGYKIASSVSRKKTEVTVIDSPMAADSSYTNSPQRAMMKHTADAPAPAPTPAPASTSTSAPVGGFKLKIPKVPMEHLREEKQRAPQPPGSRGPR